MGRRNDHSKEELRNMALIAAEHILINEGYEKLTTRRLAKEIGYTVGSLYMVFKNIDELMLTINARTLTDLFIKIREDIEPIKEDDPVGALLQIAQSYVDFAFENTERWLAIFIHRVTDVSLLNEEYYQHIAELFYLIVPKIKRIAHNKDEIEIETLARALWGGVHGVVHLSLDNKLNMGLAVERDAKQVVEALVRNALLGIQQ